jgi:thiol-disulfide isomerase/thioredoxin
MPLLRPGDPFPELMISTIGGPALALPGAFAGGFSVVLFYRGAWCPYCNALLRAFERASQPLADAGIRVASLSVDEEESTAALAEKHKLTFPLGYGADAAGGCRRPGSLPARAPGRPDNPTRQDDSMTGADIRVVDKDTGIPVCSYAA